MVVPCSGGCLIHENVTRVRSIEAVSLRRGEICVNATGH